MPNSPFVRDRLRVCVISFMFSPLIGGAEVQAEKHARQLQALGHDVTVVTLRVNRQWPQKEILDGLPVVRLGGWYRRNGWLHIGRVGHFFFEIAMFLKLWQMQHQYDVIHCMQLSSLGAMATLISKLTHKPIIHSIQSAGPNEQQHTQLQQGVSLMADTITTIDPSFLKVADDDWVAGDVECLPRSTLAGPIFLHFLKKSDAFYQVLSTRIQSSLIANGFKPEHIIRIPNGVDMEKFCPAPHMPASSRPERDILCVARLEYPKGVDVLLHAWGRMMKEPIEWRKHLKPHLRIVGQGVFRPQMERIVAELGIENSVEFLGLRRDIVELLQQSWGFVMPSRWEGMPNALLEAMAVGLPCVATRVSGSEDFIIDGVNGLLVEPEQPAEMAKALRRLIENEHLAYQMAQAARTTILRDYQISAIVKQCLRLYYRLLACRDTRLSLVREEGGEG